MSNLRYPGIFMPIHVYAISGNQETSNKSCHDRVYIYPTDTIN